MVCLTCNKFLYLPTPLTFTFLKFPTQKTKSFTFFLSLENFDDYFLFEPSFVF